MCPLWLSPPPAANISANHSLATPRSRRAQLRCWSLEPPFPHHQAPEVRRCLGSVVTGPLHRRLEHNTSFPIRVLEPPPPSIGVPLFLFPLPKLYCFIPTTILYSDKNNAPPLRRPGCNKLQQALVQHPPPHHRPGIHAADRGRRAERAVPNRALLRFVGRPHPPFMHSVLSLPSLPAIPGLGSVSSRDQRLPNLARPRPALVVLETGRSERGSCGVGVEMYVCSRFIERLVSLP
jgi:hypothetical protein